MTGPRDPTLTLILNAALPLLHLAYEQVLRMIEAALQAYGTHAPAGLPDLIEALHAVGKDGGGRAKLARLLADAIARHPEATDPASQLIAAVLAALTAVDGEEQPGAAAAPEAVTPPPLEKGGAPPPDVATAGRGPAGFDPFALTRQQLLREVLRALALDPGRFYAAADRPLSHRAEGRAGRTRGQSLQPEIFRRVAGIETAALGHVQRTAQQDGVCHHRGRPRRPGRAIRGRGWCGPCPLMGAKPLWRRGTEPDAALGSLPILGRDM